MTQECTRDNHGVMISCIASHLVTCAVEQRTSQILNIYSDGSMDVICQHYIKGDCARVGGKCVFIYALDNQIRYKVPEGICSP